MSLLHPHGRGSYQPLAASSNDALDPPSPTSHPHPTSTTNPSHATPARQYYDDDPSCGDEHSNLLAPSPNPSKLDLSSPDLKLTSPSVVDLHDSAGITADARSSHGRRGTNPEARRRLIRNVLLAGGTIGFALLVVWLFSKVVGLDAIRGVTKPNGTSPEGQQQGAADAGKPDSPSSTYSYLWGPSSISVAEFASLDGSFGHQGYGYAPRPTATGATGDQVQDNVVGGATSGFLSNGTHEYEKTVIMISLGGFGQQYLERGRNKKLRKGLVAKYLRPVFPTLNYPNHWSLLTGLYSESHGIVSDDFVDLSNGKIFNGTDGGVGAPDSSWDSSWWSGEPIWATAEKAGIKTANLHWPGPPQLADGTRSFYWYPTAARYNHVKKLARIAGWLDLAQPIRPRLITVHMPEAFNQGRRTSPRSKSINRVLSLLDTFTGNLQSVISERNLTQIVELIFVSDHGMSTVSDENVVYLDRILGGDWARIRRWDGRPDAMMWFEEGMDTAEVVDRLEKHGVGGEGAAVSGGFDVYSKDDMPEEYHYTENGRIPDVVVVPKPGFVLTTAHEHVDLMKGRFTPRGVSGYSPSSPEMQGIFIAQGPFADSVKARRRARRSKRSTHFGRPHYASHLRRGHVHASHNQQRQEDVREGEAEAEAAEDEDVELMDGFENTEIYGLVASLLGIEKGKWARNNGTEGFWDAYLGDGTSTKVEVAKATPAPAPTPSATPVTPASSALSPIATVTPTAAGADANSDTDTDDQDSGVTSAEDTVDPNVEDEQVGGVDTEADNDSANT